MHNSKWRTVRELSNFAALPDGRIFLTGGCDDAWGLRVTFFNPDARTLGLASESGLDDARNKNREPS